MSPSIQDLRVAMESVRAQAQHPPDRLDLIRRRVRRGARIRIASGAVVTALAVGGAFAFLSPGDTSGGPSAAGPAPSLTGSPATGLRATEEGMSLVVGVKYSVLNQMARLTFTPTGKNSMVAYFCDQPGLVYDVGIDSGSFECGNPQSADAPPDQPVPGATYLDTSAGVPVTLNMFASDSRNDPGATSPTGPRRPGGWTVAVYSGTCTSPHCTMSTTPEPQTDPTKDMKLLSKHAGTADSRRIPVPTKGRAVELHLVCDAGPAWAVTWLDGKISKAIPCEAAESRGVFWSQKPGRLEIAVFPASAEPLTHPTAAQLAELMKHPDPMGKWKLQVYDRG